MSVINEHHSSDGPSQLKQCRICLDDDNPDDIISPCLCSGGSAYVHKTCLNNWRAENANGKAFKFCDVCKFEYIIESVMNDSKDERKRLLKYHFFVIRDLTLVTLLIQSVIIGLGFLLKTIDKSSNNISDLYPDFINGFTVYYLSAFILLLAVLGLIVFIIFCYTFSNSSGTLTNFHRFSSSNKNGLFFMMVGVVIVCAVVGLFVGIVLSVIIIRKVMKHHAGKLWLRQEAEKYIVKDFTGRREELDIYRTNYRNSNGDNTDNSFAQN